MAAVDTATTVIAGIVVIVYLFFLLLSYVIFRYAVPAQRAWQGRTSYSLIIIGALLSMTSLFLLFFSAGGVVEFPKWFRIGAAIGMTITLGGATILFYARHRGWAN